MTPEEQQQLTQEALAEARLRHIPFINPENDTIKYLARKFYNPK